jgi:hypothetical protein
MRKSLYLGYKGRLEAYIYIWFSKSTKLVYVGETNNIHGVIGRATQHVGHSNGTLYHRVYDKGYDLDQIDDLVLLSYPLPREKRYTSEETGYRISVEYLVQKKLIENKIKSVDSYTLVSNVDVGPYTDVISVQNLAQNIALDFAEAYNEL